MPNFISSRFPIKHPIEQYSSWVLYHMKYNKLIVSIQLRHWHVIFTKNKVHHYNYFSSFYTLCTILMTIDWISYKIISTLEINYQSYQITQSIVQTLSVTLLLEHTLILLKTLSYYKNLHSYSTTIYILYNVIKRHFSSFIMKQINFRYIIIKNASIHKT